MFYNSQNTVATLSYTYGPSDYETGYNGSFSNTIPSNYSIFLNNVINNNSKYNIKEFEEEIKIERRPRLGKNAKITRHNPRPIQPWNVLDVQPLIVLKLDSGYTRMRGGKFRHFFKNLKKTTGKFRGIG